MEANNFVNTHIDVQVVSVTWPINMDSESRLHIGHHSKHTINNRCMKNLHLFMSDAQGKEEAQGGEDHPAP